MEYKGIVESAKFVDEIVKREGIDGLLGFSQGATLIGEMLKRSSESAGRRYRRKPRGSDADEEFTIRGVDFGYAEQSGRNTERTNVQHE